MKDLIKVKVVMLPTEKANSIFFDKMLEKVEVGDISEAGHPVMKNQHLYLVSEEKPTKDEFYIHMQNGSGLRLTKCISLNLPMDSKKVIASTDEDLMLPPIPESFIKEYVESNGIIEERFVNFDSDIPVLHLDDDVINIFEEEVIKK